MTDKAQPGRVASPDKAADDLCAVLTSMESVGTQHDDAVIVSRSHYERWQRQIGHSGLDPEFERIVTAARATHREALDRLAATDRCSHGENPDPNCHWCRPLSSTPPRPEDCAHESLVRTKDARWYCGACGVWFVPEAPDV